MASASLKLASDHTVADGTPLIDRPSETSETARRIERLPTEVGVLLLSAGVTMGLTPPPPGPFDLSIMLSGGLILWPRGFRAIDGWARKRFPTAHRAGMQFLDRYLDDLERRYPDSTGCPSSSERTPQVDG